jgi:hypothetical protein
LKVWLNHDEVAKLRDIDFFVHSCLGRDTRR